MLLDIYDLENAAQVEDAGTAVDILVCGMTGIQVIGHRTEELTRVAQEKEGKGSR